MKYPMGTFVTVAAYMQRFKDRIAGQKNKTVWFTRMSCIPRTGMVIGMKRVQEGEVDWDEDRESFLVPTAHLTVYVVSFGALNRPWLVNEEDMQPAEPVKLPVLAMPAQMWDEAARAEQRQYASGQKREKGRFVK